MLPLCLFSLSLVLLLSTLVSGFSSPNTQQPTVMNSLGADALKELVQEAAVQDTASTLDVTGILWLEHINLVVGSRPLAERFYLDILGFSKDKSKSFHVNLGQQQFHLAETGDPAQKVTGSIGLVVPSIDTVKQRLQEALAGDEFKDTLLAMDSTTKSDDTTLSITCPWGNRLHLYDATQEQATLQPTSDSPRKMVNMHATGGNYAPERMGIRGGNPGIRYIEIACPPQSTPAIASFYRNMLSCTVTTTTISSNRPAIAVCVGPGVHLAYVEDDNLSQDAISAMEGVHLCIYVNGFKNLYDRLKTRNLIWTNPRFTHLDSCDTWEEAMESRTLRFKDIVDLSTGEKLLEVEHETRPMRHGQYLKVPFYEPK
ncbi:expressed unknown protein [Seminavis robusta]|uniref:VOC domain-containing protein n=1 Tax=Seminavis robusta TaxID=568900 RepID=A0A9N8DXV5_9STRA|nr:expressed unknown protein [Seminavis robusta]|eukprot:Sro460_g147460.1 n/a (371) ;mRNA; r:20802-21914